MFKFPYTNLHELNLDWILQKLKTLIENNDEFNDKADYAVETADEAKEIAEQAAAATIPDGSITTPKLADYAVTQVKLAANAVGNYQLQDSSITNQKIYDEAVTPVKTSFFRQGVLQSIPYGNTTTIIDENIVEGDGYYFIALMSITASPDAGSVYFVRIYNTATAFTISPVYEGQNNAAPRIINNTGVLDLAGSTTNRDISFAVFKLN